MSLQSQQLLINGNVLDSRLAVSVSAFYTKNHRELTGIEPLDKEPKNCHGLLTFTRNIGLWCCPVLLGRL